MNALPLIERELKQASKKAGTYWVRIGSVLFTSMLLLMMVHPNTIFLFNFLTSNGNVFAVISLIGFIFTTLGGLMSTTDAIGVERRQGTLPLLFLTHLDAKDVLLAKLVSNGCLIAAVLLSMVVPLAICLTLGGLSFNGFLSMVFSLIANLFTWSCIGLFLSAQFKQNRESVGTGFALLLAVSIALFSGEVYLGRLGSVVSKGGDVEILVLLSAYAVLVFCLPVLPYYLAVESFIGSSGGGIRSFLDTQGISPAFVVLAAVLTGSILLYLGGKSLARNWKDEFTQPPAHKRGKAGVFKFGSWFRDLNQPIHFKNDPYTAESAAFHLGRSRLKNVFQGNLLWTLSFLVPWALVSPNAPAELNASALSFILFLNLFHQKYWMAGQSSRLLAEDKKSGALELILTTELDDEDILQGYRNALWSRVKPCLITAVLFPTCLIAILMPFMEWIHAVVMFLIFHGMLIMHAMELGCLGSFGLWNGLRTGQASKAKNQTLILLIVTFSTYFFLGLGPAIIHEGNPAETVIYGFLTSAMGTLLITVPIWITTNSKLVDLFSLNASQFMEQPKHPWVMDKIQGFLQRLLSLRPN